MITTVELSPEQEAWLKQAVASGQFASIEEAMQNGIETLRAESGVPMCEMIGISQEQLDADITEAEASLARGAGREMEPIKQRLARLHETHRDLISRASDH